MPPDETSAKPRCPPAELEALMLEILAAFFDLRSAGQTLGAVTESGAGSWGLLRLIEEGGPATMADIARRRGVTRQYIQRLANELVAEGLLDVVANPRHRRAGLLTLTAAGRRHLRQTSERIREHLGRACGGLDLTAVVDATRTLQDFRERIATRSGAD